MKLHLINEKFDPMVDDPTNYKWGIFYFNRKDNRNIVPKRNWRLGWTVNFAHPYAWWWIISIVAFIALAIVMGYLI
jgi:uncharacterized membrane protein